MRRLLAILVLTIGLIPSIPALYAYAASPSQEDLVRYCRDKLGYGQTQRLVGSSVFLLRSCITDIKKQSEADMRFENVLQRKDQHFWKRYEYGQKILKESQRSLQKRIENKVAIRETYYRQTSVEQRQADLLKHIAARRAAVRIQEQNLLRDKRAAQEKWKNAIQACRSYDRAEREQCVQFLLTQ